MKKILISTFVVFSMALTLQAQLWIDQRADELFLSGDYTYAASLYKKIKSKRKADYIHSQLGRCYFLMKDYPNAEAHFLQVTNYAKTGYDYTQIDLGRALLMQGKYNEAQNQFLLCKESGIEYPLLTTYLLQCENGLKQVQPDEKIRFVKTTYQSQGYFLGATYVGRQWLFAEAHPQSVVSRQFDYPGYGLSAGKWNGHELQKDSILQSSLSKFYLASPSYDFSNQRLYYSRNVSDVKISRKKKLSKHNLPFDAVNRLQIFSVPFHQGVAGDELSFLWNSDSYNTTHPFVFQQGNAMLFSSDRPGGFGGYDLYITYKSGNEWSEPVNLGSQINSIGHDMFPFVHGDSVLYYASDGKPGLGGADLYKAAIHQRVFYSPIHLGPGFNSSFDDFGLWMTDDRHGYFASNRYASPGKDELFAFELPKQCFDGKGMVIDRLTLKPMKNVDVKIYQQDTLLAVVKTDDEGFYFYPCFTIDMEYELVFEEPQFRIDTLFVLPRKSRLKQLDMYMTPIVEKNMVFTFNDILFEYNKSDLLFESKIVLDRLAELLKESGARVELSAHTDSRGNDAYNLRLSQRRAESCIQYLTSQGVAINQLSAKGYGESKIKNRCRNGVTCNEEEHTLNRRVEITVLETKP